MKQCVFNVCVMSNLILFSDVVTGSVVSQPDQVIISRLGETVTVKCMTLKDKDRYLLWYQQRLGQMPRCICMARKHTDPYYVGEFKDSHITCQTTEGFDLEIRNNTWSDEASYYCASRNTSHLLDFAEGTFIRIIGNVAVIVMFVDNIKDKVPTFYSKLELLILELLSIRNHSIEEPYVPNTVIHKQK